MSSFLTKTAQYLLHNYNDELEQIAIVLPNKRAGLFLKQELSKLIDAPIWLPEIMGAEDFIETLSKTEIIDNTFQLFELFECYKQITKEPEPFEEFSKWGQILIHDFNEIDRYLIPTEPFFKHINEIRALEIWNLGEKEITELQSQYIKFWKQIGSIYKQFHTHLESKQCSYQGMAFRKVADEIATHPEKFIEENIKWKKILFIGFNALNKAEEIIITTLINQKKAEILWDADVYYLNDELQESGMFLRQFQHKEVFTPFKWISDKFNTTDKEISIIGIPQHIGQAKYIPTLLKKIDSTTNYKDTAIVLADENMLVPVMQSIPENITAVNVTMGYPLKNTTLANFFDIYFTALVNGERYGKKDKLTYHYTDLLKIVQHPFAKNVFGEITCEDISQHIIKHNWVFINNDKLQFINSLTHQLFSESIDSKTIITNCQQFITHGRNYFHQVNKNNTSDNFKLELEYLFQFSKLFNQLELLLINYPVISSIKGFYSIFKQLMNNYSIELYGEPLQGLQVMGMLETRNIDFKNVIIIGANEDILPKGKSFNSFIPYDLKKIYALPTHQEKDAVYAYHFYRLIQNASSVSILYNTETNEFGSGEQSRFVTQIEHELSKKENISISKKLINYSTIKTELKTEVIEKTPEIINGIKMLLKKGISPSALNTYLACPLDFYYKYILQIYESEQVEETIEHTTFGSYIHKILELLYKETIGITLKVEHIEQMILNLPETAKKVFSEGFSDAELNNGKNLIIFSVAENYIKTFLTNEIDFIRNTSYPITIIALEKKMDFVLSLSLEKETLLVNLKGIADRIDFSENTTRIIDYKTGLVEPKNLAIKELNELMDSSSSSKAFQVLFYSYLYSKTITLENNNQSNLKTGIISFRKLSAGFMPFNLDKNNEISTEILYEFELILQDIFTEMLDVSIPFAHSIESNYCKFCE